MRHEAAVPKGPQQFVDNADRTVIACVDVDRVVEAIGFLCQSARKRMTCVGAALAENVEVDTGHIALRKLAAPRQDELGQHRHGTTGGPFLRAGHPGRAGDV